MLKKVFVNSAMLLNNSCVTVYFLSIYLIVMHLKLTSNMPDFKPLDTSKCSTAKLSTIIERILIYYHSQTLQGEKIELYKKEII